MRLVTARRLRCQGTRGDLFAVRNDGRAVEERQCQENFRRTFELDPSIDTNKITAKVEQGLVTLTLPKAEHVKPRKIAVS
jgi:HSP20 family molecular chaperone IbpA